MAKLPVDPNRQHQLELQAMLKNQSGRNVLKTILIHTGYFEGNFDPTSDRRQVFNEGRRNEGLWLVEQMKLADLELFNLLMKEINDD